MIDWVKQCEGRIPRQYLDSSLKPLWGHLQKRHPQLKVLDLTVAFVNDKAMKRLNQQYRHRAKTTDVLSFTSIDPSQLGDLVISLPQARKQAHEHGLSLQDELVYLILHGILHLLGYEHEQGGESAAVMYDLQDGLFDAHLKRQARRRRQA